MRAFKTNLVSACWILICILSKTNFHALIIELEIVIVKFYLQILIKDVVEVRSWKRKKSFLLVSVCVLFAGTKNLIS